MTLSICKTYRSLLAIALLAVAAVPGPADVFAREPSTAERLQRLEDKEAIHALLERFFEFQESREFESFANLFAKDGELILRRGTTRGGPAGIKAAFTREPREPAGANAPNASMRGMRHILSNVHIVLNGDTATAMSRWTMLVQGDDGRTRLGGSGRYGDKLVRENGEWKFQQRILYRDLPLDPSAAAAPAK